MTYPTERAEIFVKLVHQAGIDLFEISDEELRVMYDKVFGDDRKYWGTLQRNLDRMRRARKTNWDRLAGVESAKPKPTIEALECRVCGGPLPAPNSKFSTCEHCRTVHIVRA